uniref:Uncharacterized protein n=1 Tax=Macrostomum lignano TaxID=282301 RepID=A0A1I8FRM6_9PLAT
KVNKPSFLQLGPGVRRDYQRRAHSAVVFPCQSCAIHYKGAPDRYLSYSLIGHEAPGSYWPYLKRKGGSNALSRCGGALSGAYDFQSDRSTSPREGPDERTPSLPPCSLIDIACGVEGPQDFWPNANCQTRSCTCPSPNPFIPTDFSLKIGHRSAQRLASAASCRASDPAIWTGGAWRCGIVCSNLYFQLLSDALNALTYDAELAGLNYRIDPRRMAPFCIVPTSRWTACLQFSRQMQSRLYTETLVYEAEPIADSVLASLTQTPGTEIGRSSIELADFLLPAGTQSPVRASVVHSHHRTPPQCTWRRRIDAFIDSIADDPQMRDADEQFQSHVAALNSVITEKPKKMTARNQLYFEEIRRGTLCFDRKERLSACLTKITKDDLLQPRQYLAKQRFEAEAPSVVARCLRETHGGIKDADYANYTGVNIPRRAGISTPPAAWPLATRPPSAAPESRFLSASAAYRCRRLLNSEILVCGCQD